MENQLLNCLLANLIGSGKQFFPQGQAAVGLSQEGQAAFFDILSQKMGGSGASSSSITAFIADEGDTAGAGETDDADGDTVAATVDSEDLSLLVSSLMSALDSSVVAEDTGEIKNVDAADIEDFLRGILEVLSGGDEIELTSPEKEKDATALPGEGAVQGNKAEGAVQGNEAEGAVQGNEAEGAVQGNKAEGAAQFMGYLVSVLLERNGAVTVGEKTGTLSADGGDIPAPKAEKPDPSIVAADPRKAAAQAVVPAEDLETSAFVVEVAKAAKKAGVQDLSPKRDVPQTVAGIFAEDESDAVKDDFLILSARRDAGAKDGMEPEKIVIRVKETEETEIEQSGDDRIIPRHDSSGHRTDQTSSEVKAVAKNDFGAMMVDRIEKLTGQYAGKGMNMDMLVKLKIDDTETVLVGLKEDGNTVTVEVRTGSENTMNFIQSQKDELVKNLESKNIFTTIHVDIDQDQQGKQQQRNDRAKEDGDPEEQQDFGAFIEALV